MFYQIAHRFGTGNNPFPRRQWLQGANLASINYGINIFTSMYNPYGMEIG